MRNWNTLILFIFWKRLCRFSAYLWGIETGGTIPIRCLCPQFSAYLWGIETYRSSDRKRIPRKAFSAYLWGIETSESILSMQTPTQFSAYLWGIETISRRKIFVRAAFVFSIPMRNWNDTQTIQARPGEVGFQHTYEELKLLLAGQITTGNHRFQHTYEELKHSFQPCKANKITRFQHTYEELKLLLKRWHRT